MRQIHLTSVFKRVLGAGAVVLVGVLLVTSRARPAAEAQGIAAPQLPLTTAYFYGPVSASQNHLVKMCTNNLFGDGSVRFAGAIINAADGRVLVGQDMRLARRGGGCLEYRPTESLDVLGVLWGLGGASGDYVWSSPRASGPVAALQLLNADTNVVIAVLNTAGKVTVDSELLPAVQ
jgi:hypothetical protein